MKRILIANRGEIAVRVMRAAKDLGITTIAVYSDADKEAYHTREADEAIHIGPAAPHKSYLNIKQLMKAIRKSGANAVHPGYGFLSENADFAKAVENEGIIFIGPSSDILSSIESKSYCRKLCERNGVPVVPGSIDIIKDVEEIRKIFIEQGPPILIKLDRGGGGKGILPINNEYEIENLFEAARSMGQAAFGSGDCYIEKALNQARHIEVQFMADNHGNYLTLGERECSIQRRYQKIIEESPSPIVTEVERKMLMEWTKKIASSMNYRNVGTIEYLRSDDGHYYFMEINARIQVEHPVTEYVTGIDIVRNQIEIAYGKKLAIRQSDVQFEGHSIQARVYAEDPVSFLPSPGVIGKLRFPVINKIKTRFDHALNENSKVSPYYDPLLAKTIVWGSTRPRAIERLLKRLAYFQIDGIKTTIPLVQLVLDTDDFKSGIFHTEKLSEIMQDYSFNETENRFVKKTSPISIEN